MDIKAIWHKLSTRGNENWETQEEQRRNTIANQVLLFYMILLFAVTSLVWGMYVYLINLDYDKYVGYAIPYSIAFYGAFLNVIFGYVFKNNPGRWPYIAGMIWMGAMLLFVALNMYAGPLSGGLFLFFILVPTPFLMGHNPVSQQIYAVAGLAVLATTQVLRSKYGGWYPLPEQLHGMFFWLCVVSSSTAVFYGIYYFWFQSRKFQSELQIAIGELEGKDKVIQTELDYAAAIQDGILPPRETNWGKLKIASYYSPLGKVSGDLIDIVDRDDHVFILMADVSGHGVPAALVTMLTKQTFTNEVLSDRGPAETFEAMNRDLANKIMTQEYLTSFMLRVDKEYSMTYCNAAHPKPVYYRAATDSVFFMDTEGLILGVVDDVDLPYTNKTLQMAPGDKVILFTDGVTEQKNENDEMFGPDRVADLMKAHKNKHAKELVDCIIAEVNTFRGTAEIIDDVTVLLFELET